jgi:sugar phosphate isomerase/epimerase
MNPTTMPRLAICNELFENWPLDQVCSLVKQIGYQGLEIAPFTLAPRITQLSPNSRDTIRKTIENHGLKAIGLHWLLAKTEEFHLTSPNPDTRRQTAAYLVALAEACRDLGGEFLVFGSPKQRDLAPGVTRQNGIQFAVEVLKAITNALDSTGVQLCLEPLGTAETNFINSIAEATEIIDQVDHPKIVLHLDVKAMAVDPEGPIPNLIRRHAHSAGHFHAQDPNRQGPGMGPNPIDFTPIAQAIADSGYKKWISVEPFDYQPGAEQTARQSHETLRRAFEKAAGAVP